MDIEKTDSTEIQDQYRFVRETGHWYICLHEKGQQWNKTDLELSEGAPKFLNVLANGEAKLHVRISKQAHDHWDVLELVNHCEAPRGGAIYLFTPSSDKGASSLFWICDLALLVFGEMPERIYLKRLPLKNRRLNHLANGGDAQCKESISQTDGGHN